ncbi:Uncharacterised protein [Vibrio cholerae]|nr:Uncharacterised protein [Vibrio cholerae]
MAKIAGIESKANITSMNAMTPITINIGVTHHCPCCLQINALP